MRIKVAFVLVIKTLKLFGPRSGPKWASLSTVVWTVGFLKKKAWALYQFTKLVLFWVAKMLLESSYQINIGFFSSQQNISIGYFLKLLKVDIVFQKSFSNPSHYNFFFTFYTSSVMFIIYTPITWYKISKGLISRIKNISNIKFVDKSIYIVLQER